MAQSVSFNINLKVNGQNSVRTVSVDMDELRRAINETKTSAEKTTTALIGFNQSMDAIHNVSGKIQQQTIKKTMDNLSQAKLIRAQFVLLDVVGKNIMIKRSVQSKWKVYMHCFSRENATDKCDDLVKRNSNYIKL